MKVLVCGKGGSGKSTVSALLAKSLASRGYEVLVIDGDESNLGLYRLLGISPPKELTDMFGGRKGITKEGMGELLKEIQGIEDIPKDYVSGRGNLRLIVIGKIKGFSEGCACPMGALLREFLKNLKFNGFVIVDTDAGVEHFGRGVEEGCDVILFVVDPTYESLMLSKKVEEMAEKAGRKLYFILNKVSEEVKKTMLRYIDCEKVISAIPAKAEIFEACLKGKEINLTIPEIDAVANFLIHQHN